MAADGEGVEDATFAGVEGNPEEVPMKQFYFRNRQVYIHVWFKGDTHTVAIRTMNRRFIQPVHQVNDYTLISLKVVEPAIPTDFSIVVRLTLTLNHRHQRFLLHSVQVFM